MATPAGRGSVGVRGRHLGGGRCRRGSSSRALRGESRRCGRGSSRRVFGDALTAEKVQRSQAFGQPSLPHWSVNAFWHLMLKFFTNNSPPQISMVHLVGMRQREMDWPSHCQTRKQCLAETRSLLSGPSPGACCFSSPASPAPSYKEGAGLARDPRPRSLSAVCRVAGPTAAASPERGLFGGGGEGVWKESLAHQVFFLTCCFMSIIGQSHTWTEGCELPANGLMQWGRPDKAKQKEGWFEVMIPGIRR